MADSLSNLAEWVRAGAVDGGLLQQRFNESPQLRHVGMRIDLSNLPRPRVFIDRIEPFHTGAIGTGAVNGGIIGMLADLTMGLLGVQYFASGMTATREIHIEFLRPLLATSVQTEAWVVATVGPRVYGHAHICDQNGRICTVYAGHIVTGLHA